MVTPYFSKLCHGHPVPVECALPELSIKELRYTKF
ncbi:unnamed protein product [Callosobruchus maculatus]|uniref:Uncharacterized protein n=1 Tax=Callosobruchus maculatus TaxID=64391 RepID=A0A653D439_CALMS|nr:unnamed protein product [Callosobruchus maculatus]